MRAELRDLAALGYARGFTLWHFKAPTLRIDEVRAAGFFDDARGVLVSGDLMLVSTRDGAGMLAVASSPLGDPILEPML